MQIGNKRQLKHFKQKLRRANPEQEWRSKIMRSRFEATAGIWDKGRLRRGERLCLDVEKRAKQQPTWHHPNAWTLSGCIREAFLAVGTMCKRSNRRTRRELDVVAAVSLAVGWHTNQGGSVWLDSILCGARKPKFVFIERCWDCTPIRISFGQLRELMLFARYWRKGAADQKCKLVSAAAMLAAQGKLPSHGTVELMGQEGHVAWSELQEGCETSLVRSSRLAFRPCLVERANGSTQLRAVDVSVCSCVVVRQHHTAGRARAIRLRSLGIRPCCVVQPGEVRGGRTGEASQ